MGEQIGDQTYRVYCAMLAAPDAGVEQLALNLGLERRQVAEALDDLAHLALLSPDSSDPMRLRPTSPRVGFSRLLTEAKQALERQNQEVRGLESMMNAAIEEAEARRADESFQVLASVEAVRERLEELAASTEVECVSLNPGKAHRPDSMSASRPVNQQVLERGVSIRSVYQESFIHDADTLTYARWLTELGGEVHTVPEVPWRLILIDRRVAIMPSRPAGSSRGALEIHNAALVAILLDYFESVWERSKPFDAAPRKRQVDKTDPMTHRLLQLLAAGDTDAAAARKLGLSDRTIRRLMSSVMVELDADSRFQAGVEAARRGWI